MPRLPTYDSLGFRDPKASYHAPNVPSSDPVSAATEQLGKAGARLGGSLAGIGFGELEDEQKADRELERARAEADFASKTIALNQQREQETDPERLGQYGAAQRKIVDDASKHFRDPREAELWRTQREPNVAQQGASASSRVRSLQTQAEMAADDQRLAELERAAEAATTPEGLAGIKTRALALIGGQEQKGYLDARRAGEARRRIDEALTHRYLLSKTPSERLRLLGPDEATAPGAKATPADLDMVARTIIGESNGQPYAGQVAVAQVVKNRLSVGGYGSTPTEVVLKPSQFEPWGRRRAEMLAIDPNSPQYKAAYEIARRVFDGQEPDPTNGATHFANVDVVKQRGDAAGKPGGWLGSMGNVTKIGAHTFGNADAGRDPEAVRSALGAGDKGAPQAMTPARLAAAGAAYDADRAVSASPAAADPGTADMVKAIRDTPLGKFGPGDVYGNIPDTDEAGRPGQIAKFLKWNPDPIGNHEKKLGEVKPQLADVVRKAQADNPGLRFVVGSGGRSEEDQKRAEEWGWSPKRHPFADAAPGLRKHLDNEAADIWSLDENGKVKFDPELQAKVGAAMKKAAADLGVPMKWGGDFKGKKDLPHFELEAGYEKVSPQPRTTTPTATPPGTETPSGSPAPVSSSSTEGQPGSPPSSRPALDPIVAGLPFDVRRRLRVQARSELAQQERDNEKALQVQRANLSSQIKDDLASVERTGQGLSGLTGDGIRSLLGTEAATQWENERARARRVYEVMDGAETLPEGEIARRLQTLEPKAGQPGYTDDLATYDHARKKLERVVELRRNDPAAAVSDFPTVKAATTEAKFQDVGGRQIMEPGSARRLVQARLDAQERLGIIEPSAVTKSQARGIARQLRMAQDDDGKLRAVVQSMHDMYGDLADEVLTSTIQSAGVNRDLAADAVDHLTKIQRGEQVRAAEARKTETLRDDQTATDSMAGQPANLPPFGMPRMPPPASNFGADAGAAIARTGPAPKTMPLGTEGPIAPQISLGGSVSGAELQALWANRGDKGFVDGFNAKYGSDSDRKPAEKILKLIERAHPLAGKAATK